jgi:hypothetical protein
LEAGGGIEVYALLAAMKSRAALWAEAFKIGVGAKRCGAIETPRGRDRLNQTRQFGSGNV